MTTVLDQLEVRDVAHVITKQRIDNARHVLARAFQDDPAPSYMIPDADERTRLLPELYRSVVRYALLYESIYTLVADECGYAVWMKPGSVAIPLHKMIRAGYLNSYLRVGLNRVGRALNYLNFAEAKRMAIVPEPHWYLFMLGVEPTRQNHGLGSSLLLPIITRADQQRLNIYLDTYNERTLSFYARHGFTIAEEGDIPKGGPHGWFMIRRPQ